MFYIRSTQNLFFYYVIDKRGAIYKSRVQSVQLKLSNIVSKATMKYYHFYQLKIKLTCGPCEKARGNVEIVKQFFLPLLAHFYITTLSPGQEKESHITMFSAVFLPSCFFMGPQSIYFVASGLVSLPVPGSSEQD